MLLVRLHTVDKEWKKDSIIRLILNKTIADSDVQEVPWALNETHDRYESIIVRPNWLYRRC